MEAVIQQEDRRHERRAESGGAGEKNRAGGDADEVTRERLVAGRYQLGAVPDRRGASMLKLKATFESVSSYFSFMS